MSPSAADDRLANQLATLATAMAMGFAGQDVRMEGGEPVVVDRDSPEATVERDELMRMVHAELSHLPEQEATFVRRHFLRGERVEDIAAGMGLSKSWGSRVMGRGMEKLSYRLRQNL